MKPDELVQLVQTLNPNKEPGKITLISRYGADKVAVRYFIFCKRKRKKKKEKKIQVREYLPKHIQAMKDAGLKAVWCCDPMHGNTHVTSKGLKTRHFDKILEELKLNFEIHIELGSKLCGVHFELTGDGVTGT